jgi:hypothetical protein
MVKKRKILPVVKRYSFAEAEEADNIYWSKQSEVYRLQTLMDLREMVFGNIGNTSIEKVVYKRSIHAQAET